MYKIRSATRADLVFWCALDKHVKKDEMLLKIRDKRAYIICAASEPIGVMRYNLFWNNILFLTFIYIDKEYQAKGYGRKAILYWQKAMLNPRHKMVITSTQIDENAQHFYRKLGYTEKGCLFFDNTPLEQPMEIFFIKKL